MERNEKGFVLATTVALIVGLLFFVAVVLGTGYTLLVKSELQAAADAAAHAGASRFKYTQGSWLDAKAAAVTVLNSHRVHTSLWETTNISLDPSQGPGWSIPNMEISIDRGRWLPGTGFVTFEGTWQDDHPGMPNFVVANAVKIEIRQPNIFTKVFDLAPLHIDLQVRAIGLSGAVGEVQAAPFAIPLCALMDDSGNINFDNNICNRDRLFTSVNRHCPVGNPNCGNVPDFNYEPVVRQGTDFTWPWAITTILGGDSKDRACFWATPRFSNVADHYGVIGLPRPAGSNLPDPLESDIQGEIEKQNPGISSYIGDIFEVLPIGLTQPLSNTILWEQITNSFSSTGQHNRFKEDLLDGEDDGGFGNDNENIHYGFRSQVTNPRATWCSDTGPFSTINASVAPRPMRPGGGTCNSFRNGWGIWSRFTIPGPGTGCNTSYTDPALGQNSGYTTTPMWQAPVAVIADSRDTASSCQGFRSSAQDPSFDGSVPYEIVGFVKMNVFDVDIGAAPPSYPHVCKDSPGFKYPDLGVGAETLPDFTWSFKDVNGLPMPCNLIRARVLCNTKFIATSNDFTSRKPRLVQ